MPGQCGPAILNPPLDKVRQVPSETPRSGADLESGERGRQRSEHLLRDILGVVVLKLFAIDLSNSGSVARIVSFMGVGGLMLLIGYLAPLPREDGK